MANSLDFNILSTNSPKTLSIHDGSIYDSIPGHPKVCILMPGFSTNVELTFQPNKINTFNSNNLGLSNVTTVDALVNLPDGIYKINYHIDGDIFVEKLYLRVDKLMCKIDNALLTIDFESCDDIVRKQKINKLTEIQFMVMAGIACANVCNSTSAVSLYRRASKELDKICKD